MTYPPVPPLPPQPPQPERKSGNTKRVLIIVIVAVVALCCLGGVGGGFLLFRGFQQAAGPVREAGSQYVADLRAGNWAAAYGQNCAANRRFATEQEFIAAQQAGPKATNYELVGTYVGNHNGRQTATLTYRVSYDNGGVRTHELPLVKEDGKWRPCP